jgi:7,8-didemethyl-8-hydroxy-5-deazariboflavin synthase
MHYTLLQECIVQPYSAAAGTRASLESFPLQDLPAVVAMARHLLPADVVVQVPPNLVHTPAVLLECLAAGARDLGGISPKDEVCVHVKYLHYTLLHTVLLQLVLQCL